VSSVAQPGGIAEGARAAPEAAVSVAPYRPGPLSRIATRLEGLGWRGWLLLAVYTAGLVAWGQAILWASGRVPFGTVDRWLLIFVVYAPYGLGTFLIGRAIGRRSLAAFWPATGWDESERPAWAYRFVQAPARVEWLAVAFGLAICGGWLVGAPAEIVGSGAERLASSIAYAPMVIAGYGVSAVLIVNGIRVLVLVDRIHREATAVDVFDRAPIYAFSRLTVFFGLVMVAAMYYTYAVNGSAQADNVSSLVFNAVAFPFGIAAFVAPLWGIHGRLVREKEQLMLDVERRITRVGAELYGRIDDGTFDSTKVITDSLGGLNSLRDRIARLPTWPWPPQLFRGFVSALLLPIIVFLITRGIAGVIRL
jgi:hypothetical protein